MNNSALRHKKVCSIKVQLLLLLCPILPKDPCINRKKNSQDHPHKEDNKQRGVGEKEHDTISQDDPQLNTGKQQEATARARTKNKHTEKKPKTKKPTGGHPGGQLLLSCLKQVNKCIFLFKTSR